MDKSSRQIDGKIVNPSRQRLQFTSHEQDLQNSQQLLRRRFPCLPTCDQSREHCGIGAGMMHFPASRTLTRMQCCQPLSLPRLCQNPRHHLWQKRGPYLARNIFGTQKNRPLFMTFPMFLQKVGHQRLKMPAGHPLFRTNKLCHSSGSLSSNNITVNTIAYHFAINAINAMAPNPLRSFSGSASGFFKNTSRKIVHDSGALHSPLNLFPNPCVVSHTVSAGSYVCISVTTQRWLCLIASSIWP